MGTEEKNRQKNMDRLRRLRPIDDDFMRCLFKNNVPLVEMVVRIITGKPDLIITDFQLKKTFSVRGSLFIQSNE